MYSGLVDLQHPQILDNRRSPKSSLLKMREVYLQAAEGVVEGVIVSTWSVVAWVTGSEGNLFINHKQMRPW